MIHRDVEETLNLSGMEIHGQQSVCAGGRDKVGAQLGRNRVMSLGLSVLSRIAEVRHDRGYSCGRGALHGVDHDEHFHEVVVDGSAGRLDDKNVGAADGLVDGNGNLTVAEGAHVGIRESQSGESAMLLATGRLEFAEKILMSFP